MTPASGVGSFSQAVTQHFPSSIESEPIDLTILHPPHRDLYRTRHRSLRIGSAAEVRPMLGLFDVVIYNIGNNRDHHEAIFDLLSTNPGVVISHDYVYQHYLADRSLRGGGGFASYAALLTSYGDGSAEDHLRRSRITNRTGQIRYSPWDSEYSVLQPLGNLLFDLASALVVHSAFSQDYATQGFRGPVLRLGMPSGQKRVPDEKNDAAWRRELCAKRLLHAVSFGHIQSGKAIDLVVSAIAASPRLRDRLRYTVAGFVGCETHFQKLRDLIAFHRLEEVVRFETDISEARLGQLMELADVFINLRRPNTEASSASLTEQLETGRPVVVLDSGCYGELPAEAALKLPPDVSSPDLRDALVRLLDDPEGMIAMGVKGRRHARRWTCASYAQALVRFAAHHRKLLGERALAVGSRPLAEARAFPADDEWSAKLAKARRSFAYLDRGVLALDPEIIMGKTREDLCRYVAEVVFGIFSAMGLQRALGRYFAGREGRAVYWACVRFSLVADAILSGDAAARDRLRAMEPLHDLEFWRVMEHLMPRHFLAAGLLLLADRVPDQAEHLIGDADDVDGFPTRLRLADLLRDCRFWREAAALPLRNWIEQPGAPPLDGDLPILDADLDWVAGGSLFRGGIDLSGFHHMEPDHVWSRGTRAFVGLRLGPDVSRIELFLHLINADARQPCEIGLVHGDRATSLQLRDAEPVWIGLDLGERAVTPIATTWIQLWTERAAPPANSDDTRTLGLCLRRLRLLAGKGRNARAVPARTRVGGVDALA